MAYRYLFAQMVPRELRQKYKGSAFGVVWYLINPLVLMGAYYFKFGVVFKVAGPAQPAQGSGGPDRRRRHSGALQPGRPAGDFVANMRRFTALGLDIAITEADIGLRLAPSEADLRRQARTAGRPPSRERARTHSRRTHSSVPATTSHTPVSLWSCTHLARKSARHRRRVLCGACHPGLRGELRARAAAPQRI